MGDFKLSRLLSQIIGDQSLERVWSAGIDRSMSEGWRFEFAVATVMIIPRGQF